MKLKFKAFKHLNKFYSGELFTDNLLPLYSLATNWQNAKSLQALQEKLTKEHFDYILSRRYETEQLAEKLRREIGENLSGLDNDRAKRYLIHLSQQMRETRIKLQKWFSIDDLNSFMLLKYQELPNDICRLFNNIIYFSDEFERISGFVRYNVLSVNNSTGKAAVSFEVAIPPPVIQTEDLEDNYLVPENVIESLYSFGQKNNWWKPTLTLASLKSCFNLSVPPRVDLKSKLQDGAMIKFVYFLTILDYEGDRKKVKSGRLTVDEEVSIQLVEQRFGIKNYNNYKSQSKGRAKPLISPTDLNLIFKNVKCE